MDINRTASQVADILLSTELTQQEWSDVADTAGISISGITKKLKEILTEAFNDSLGTGDYSLGSITSGNSIMGYGYTSDSKKAFNIFFPMRVKHNVTNMSILNANAYMYGADGWIDLQGGISSVYESESSWKLNNMQGMEVRLSNSTAVESVINARPYLILLNGGTFTLS